MLYHVEHATAAIYMERVAGHSLKTVLQQGTLQGAGALRRCRAAPRLLLLLLLLLMMAGPGRLAA